MAEKITSFPILPEVPIEGDPSFQPAPTTGFAKEFRGDIYSSRGRFGNGTAYVDIGAEYIQSNNFVSGSSGWRINYDGSVEFEEGVFRGSIEVASIHIPDQTTANSFHTNTTGDSYWGCNVSDWASDNDNAAAYILKTGVTKFQSLTVVGGTIDGTSTIGGRTGTALAAAINASNNLVTDIINARLDTSSKNILSDFNFGTTNYAGAVKSGDITWNTTTGAITGGSGVVVYRSGIVGAKDGATTFSITTAGDATFAGTLSAAAGTLGTITAGTFTGCLFQTDAGATDGIKMDTTSLRGYDVENNISFQIDRYTGEMSATNYRLHGVPSLRFNYVAGDDGAAYFHAVYKDPATGTIKRASSSIQSHVTNFLGISSTESYSSGDPVTVHQTGIVRDPDTNSFGKTGGLTPGSSYYLTSSTGLIGTSPGTYYCKVGTAIDSHTLRLEGSGYTKLGESRTFNRAYSLTGSTYQQITSAYEAEPNYLFQAANDTTTNVIEMYRYSQTPSGMYMYDGTTDSRAFSTDDPVGIIQIGNYVYASSDAIKRYDLALANETSMTFDQNAKYGFLATDGTYFYIADKDSTSVYKYSISGTDLTYVSATVIGTASGDEKYGFFVDKDTDDTLHFYWVDGNGKIYKYSQSGTAERSIDYRIAANTADYNQCRGIVKMHNTIAIISYQDVSKTTFGELIATIIPKF